MKKLVTFFILVVSLTIGAGQLPAHHGTGISYDLENPPITLKGTVKELKWANPHIAVYLDVKDDSGNVITWAIEGSSIISHARRGDNRNTLKAGQEVTAVVYPSKVKGTPVGVLAKVILPDGKEVLRFQRDTPGQEVR